MDRHSSWGAGTQVFQDVEDAGISATLLDILLPLPTKPCSFRRTVPSLSLMTTPKLAVPPGLTGSQAPSNQARYSFMLLSRRGGGRGGGSEEEVAGGEDGGGANISEDTLLLCLLTFELSAHGVVMGDSSSLGPLGSPLWAVSPSLCPGLIVGIRGMASLAWGSLSPDLISSPRTASASNRAIKA